MIYYQARQRLDGRWDWTGMRDDLIFRTGPCIGHDDGHATREEAERHFYEYEIERLKEVEIQWFRCSHPGCHELSRKGLETPRLYPFPEALCDAHRTTEVFREIKPFYTNIAIVSSW